MRRILLLAIPLVLPHTGLAQSGAAAPSLVADSLYQAGAWDDAAELYQEAATQHPDSGRFWYRLGASLYQAGRYDPAVAALARAVETFRPPSYAHYLLAQVHASAGRDAEAIAEIRRAADAGGVPYAVLVSTEAFAGLADNGEYQALMASLDPCGAPEYRQFDFWIGEWEVRNPSGQLVGTNSISRAYDGCLLVERWEGASGGAGTSQNFYHQGDGRWHQNWIDSQASGPLWLVGGLDEGGSMVMTDADPEANPRNRITWTPNPDRTVRQHWEQSSDGGATWSTVFDGLYAPRDPAGG